MNLRYLYLLCFLVISCSPEDANDEQTRNTKDIRFFERQDNTGIDFNNTIIETTEDNVILNEGLLQGAGVGIIDVNNDGLQDIYFAGNQVADRLYLNKGDLVFEDISSRSDFSNNKDWSTGISIADVNADGYEDIYVCKYLYDDKNRRANCLYINNGDMSFTERAKEYGLDDYGRSITSNFFDFDNDGDLDLYVCNQPPTSFFEKKEIKGVVDYQYTDRLYRNDGGKFKDVTKEMGMLSFGYSLSATAADINNDGWMDLYVAVDYEEPDMLYINNGDGTFKNTINESMKHIGNFSMGADIADINNDGHLDLYIVDMVAEDNYRQKTNMSGMNPERFNSLVAAGYHHQYMFNSLQLNNGNTAFSEIAQLSGISNTDWSWSPLFIDVDNDGYKDLLVTNGLLKDIRNKDFDKKRQSYIKKKQNSVSPAELLSLAEKTPSFKIANYSYRNLGNLKFEKVNNSWGISDEGWSQGMVQADLDNDGDLDIVMNNTNDTAWLYKNLAADKKVNNFLNISLKGQAPNHHAIGSRISIKTEDLNLIADHIQSRGYMSSSQAISHFGLGQNKKADVKITFPNGNVWQKKSVSVNQTLQVSITDALDQKKNASKPKKLFTAIQGTNHKHIENPYDDYKKEILIPYKLSSLGPILEKTDLNKDGNDDFYIGGSIGSPGVMYLSDGNGGFKAQANKSFASHNAYEDGAASFVDINKDGNMDLYVASGGNEYPDKHEGYNDRLYINGGDGNIENGVMVPDVELSTGSISFIDFNKDGNVDLFMGGRQVPGQYGRSAQSKIIMNDGTQFDNVTDSIAPSFKELGMVTDSEVVDIDGDGTEELIVVGEWMPISIYHYDGNQMVAKNVPGLDKTNGMWNTLRVEDIDGDGNLDIIAGNLGLNNKYSATTTEPFKLFVNDFDNNGTNDVYLGFNQDGKTFPVRGRQCSSEQMPFVAEKFETYDVFGKSTVEDVLEGKEEGMDVKEAYTFAHTVFYGNGSGGFQAQTLPIQSQVAPANGIAIYDFDGDGDLDIFTAGNFYDREVETTRSDAGVGCVMLNQGNRKWKAMHPTESGIMANGDVRAVEILEQKNGKPILAIANNNSPMQFYQLN
jgi:hypothetical protein